MGQGGNAWEWMETNLSGTNDASGSSRVARGGSWYDVVNFLASSYSDYGGPSLEYNLAGFRVASSELAAVPEVTSSFTLLGLISSGLMLRRRTKNPR